jgi:O-acetyl-ADP-ribose deacetylase (regulator of RNase III)
MFLLFNKEIEMKYVDGDLLEMFEAGEFDLIAHGCNCRKKMKSGIAGQIVKKYPIVEERDKLTSNSLGTKLGCVDFIHLPNSRIIANAYTQLNYGRDENTVYVDYNAVRECFLKIERYVSNLERLHNKNIRIGIPKIGCGLAKGDWNVVESILEEDSFQFIDLTVVEYNI